MIPDFQNKLMSAWKTDIQTNEKYSWSGIEYHLKNTICEYAPSPTFSD